MWQWECTKRKKDVILELHVDNKSKLHVVYILEKLIFKRLVFWDILLILIIMDKLSNIQMFSKIILSLIYTYYVILFGFPIFRFERTWWRLFQKRVMCTKFDIYVFITITESISLLVDSVPDLDKERP